MARNLIIFCDESTEKGRYFSHFYGGILVDEKDRQGVEDRLRAVKVANNLMDELKWTKITEAYKNKYLSFIDAVFDEIESGSLKVRVMFTQNSKRATNLAEHQIDNQYFLLYYQLIKHAFGLMHCGVRGLDTRIILMLDDIPKNAESFESFKSYLQALSTFPKFSSQKVKLVSSDIHSVNSKSHAILQGLDIIMGAMQFRLNDKHKDIPVGKKRRAKRTIAKEEVYKHINNRIRSIYRNFNIGVSTATRDDITNRWSDPYRHWLFIPTEYEVVAGQGKGGKQTPRVTSP